MQHTKILINRQFITLTQLIFTLPKTPKKFSHFTSKKTYKTKLYFYYQFINKKQNQKLNQNIKINQIHNTKKKHTKFKTNSIYKTSYPIHSKNLYTFT